MTKKEEIIITPIDKMLAVSVLKLLPRWMTPNQITMFRLFTVPVIGWMMWNGMYTWGLPFFAFSMFTDAVDGAQARTQDKITTFGKLMDPVADKLLIGTVALIIIGRFASPYLAFVIVGVEVFLISGGLFQKFVLKKDIQAEITGKIKVVLQTFGVMFILAFAVFQLPIFLTLGVWTLYGAIALALVSLIVFHAI